MNQPTAIQVSIEVIDEPLPTQRRPSRSSPQPADPALPKASAPLPRAHRTVVYFETSNAEAGFFLTCSAKAKGCRVYRATDPTELYHLALTVHPSLIVLGSTEAGGEAIALIGGLRDIPSLDDIPVVLLSDSRTDRSVRAAFAMGVTRYILKAPVESERVACILALLTDSHESETTIDAYEISPGDGAVPGDVKPGRRAWPPVVVEMASDGHGSRRYPWFYRQFAESSRSKRNA